jgi:hypothetical protein
MNILVREDLVVEECNDKDKQRNSRSLATRVFISLQEASCDPKGSAERMLFLP